MTEDELNALLDELENFACDQGWEPLGFDEVFRRHFYEHLQRPSQPEVNE